MDSTKVDTFRRAPAREQVRDLTGQLIAGELNSPRPVKGVHLPRMRRQQIDPPIWLESLVELTTSMQCAGLLISVCFASTLCRAQGLVPSAYPPTNSNAIVLTYTFIAGNAVFDSTSPITDLIGQISLPVLSYYHGFGLFGH